MSVYLYRKVNKGNKYRRLRNMSKELIWDYAKWLIKTGRRDTLSNFKKFKEIDVWSGK